MNLEKVMTKEEKEAVQQLIRAHLGVQFAQAQLAKAQAGLREATQEFNGLWSACDENDQSLSTIPDSFVAYYGGEPYLILIDENSAEWSISLIGGVLGSSPADM